MVDKILDTVTAGLEKWMTPDNYRICLGCMDLTTLNPTDTCERVVSFVEKVNGAAAAFPDCPLPAAICVYPNWGGKVKESLRADGVRVAVVAGSFPSSQTFLEVKLLECRMAVERGADEVDIVLALNSFLQGDYEKAADEIRQIKGTIGDRHLKVILETGALASDELIDKASRLAMDAGADFIKTSTGKMEPAATPRAAVLMCLAIKEHYMATGKKVGFKPAGGISTAKDAVTYLAIVDTILGKGWLNPQLFRIGASRLANNLLGELQMKKTIYY